MKNREKNRKICYFRKRKEIGEKRRKQKHKKMEIRQNTENKF